MAGFFGNDWSFSIQDFCTNEFRYLLLFAALGLSACNGSESSTNDDPSTFDVETAAAKARLDGWLTGSRFSEKNAALTAAEDFCADRQEL